MMTAPTMPGAQPFHFGSNKILMYGFLREIYTNCAVFHADEKEFTTPFGDAGAASGGNDTTSLHTRGCTGGPADLRLVAHPWDAAG